MQGKSRSVMVVLSVVLLLLLALTAQAQDGTAAAPGAQIEVLANGTTRITTSSASQATALAFWTHERLAAAKPMEIPMAAEAPRAPRMRWGRMPTYDGGQAATGGAPMAGADAAAQAAYPEDWAMLDEAAAEMPLAADGTSGVYTSYTINKQAALWKTAGHKPAGRLSFSTPGGTSYCSASVISGRNIIVTAAHCVYDTPSANRFYSNWVFTPAYRNGAAPYGTFPAQTCWVLTSWVNLAGGYAINNWADDDVAVCRMGPNSSGQTLSNLTGWYGRRWDAGYIQHVHNLGYPFRNYQNNVIPDAGKYLVTCIAETRQQAVNVLGMGCNWGGGISGGPWIISYDPFDPVTSYVNSVNSGIFVGQQNIYGARFNSANIVPLCNAAGC